MPSFALPRFLETHADRIHHAKKLERIARQTGNAIEPKTSAHTAADSLTLRGIPAIGRGVAGVIPGMRPDAITNRD